MMIDSKVVTMQKIKLQIENMKKNSLIYIIFTSLVFSAMEPFSKLLAGHLHPITLTFERFLIGSLMLLPSAVYRINKNDIKLRRRNWVSLAFQGVFCVCLSMGLLQLAVFKSKSIPIIAIVFSSNSVMTVIFASWYLKEPLTLRKVTALILCIIGAIVCSGVSSGEETKPILLAFLAAIAMSLFTILGKKNIESIPTSVQIGLSFSIGTIVLGLILLFAGIPLISFPKDFKETSIVLFLGVVATGFGYLSYFKALEKSGAFMASLVFFIKPILAPLMALMVLGNISGGANLLIAAIFVLLGSALMLCEQKNQTIRKE